MILEEGKLCRMNEQDDRTVRCLKDIDFTKYPGFKCNRADLCHGTLKDGFCRGKSEGSVCTDHIDCDVGLRCGLELKCERAAEEGERCDDAYLLCQSYLMCKEGTCMRYGFLDNGHNPGKAGVDACHSHYLDTHGVCNEGPFLRGEVFVESNDINCVYSDGREGHAVCGYHAEGKAICKPGEITLEPRWHEVTYTRKL